VFSDLSIECFEKGRRNRPLWPLQSLKEFELIFDGGAGKATTGTNPASPTRSSTNNGRSSAERQTGSQSPVRRARSLSPVKESTNGSNRETAAKSRQSATGLSAAAPKSTTPSSERSSYKKSPKAAFAGTVEEEENDAGTNAAAETTANARVIKSRRSKTAVDELKNDAAVDDNEKSDQNTDVPAAERNKPQLKGGPGRSVDVRNGKPLPYLARPGVARQSTSNTMRDMQVRKKRVSDTNSGGIESSEDNKPSRGS
jgi:hypothetical protein